MLKAQTSTACYGSLDRMTLPKQSSCSKTASAPTPLRELGVSDTAFHKKCGLKVEDLAKSNWVYRKLRNLRAGIEAGISCLKRAYGLTRCTWRSLDHFKSYVWSSVVDNNNLAIYARLELT